MLIKVKVFPNARENKIIKESEDNFKVSVKAKPIRGAANMAVQEVIASYFDISQHKVKLIKGFKDSNKIYSVNI